MNEPSFTWSQESTRADAEPVSLLTRLTNAAKARAKKKKDDDDDDNDLPGPNAVATFFPQFLNLRFAGPATA